MKGILYGVGVGPGDPELLTAKAIRLLRECDAVAAPKSADGRQTALDIASPYIGQDKSILLFDMPMTHDRQARNASHDAAADALCALLDEGKTVVFLTLGDPTIYSTYWYVHKRVAARGYAAELVPGVPSFCAAAAAMGRALCEDGEMLHIIPATHGRTEEGLALSGQQGADEDRKECIGGPRTAPSARRTRQRGADRAGRHGRSAADRKFR